MKLFLFCVVAIGLSTNSYAADTATSEKGACKECIVAAEAEHAKTGLDRAAMVARMKELREDIDFNSISIAQIRRSNNIRMHGYRAAERMEFENLRLKSILSTLEGDLNKLNTEATKDNKQTEASAQKSTASSADLIKKPKSHTAVDALNDDQDYQTGTRMPQRPAPKLTFDRNGGIYEDSGLN